MPTIQAYDINKETIIDAARWHIDSSGDLKIGDPIQIVLDSEDKDLFAWISKNQSSYLSVDKENGSTEYSIILMTYVTQIRHMLDAKKNETSKLESFIAVAPPHRNIELVLKYVLDKDSCDPKFIELVRKSSPGKKTKTTRTEKASSQ